MFNPSENDNLCDQLAAIAARLNQVEIDSLWCHDALQILQQQVQELRRGEDYYRQLFETAKDGITILNASDGRILDSNPYLAGLIGRTRQELRQMKFWGLSVSSSAVQLQNYFTQLQQKNAIRFDDVCLTDQDGQCIPVDVIANTFEDMSGKKIQCNIRRKRQQWEPETLS